MLLVREALPLPWLCLPPSPMDSLKRGILGSRGRRVRQTGRPQNAFFFFFAFGFKRPSKLSNPSTLSTINKRVYPVDRLKLFTVAKQEFPAFLNELRFSEALKVGNRVGRGLLPLSLDISPDQRQGHIQEYGPKVSGHRITSPLCCERLGRIWR